MTQILLWHKTFFYYNKFCCHH